MADRTDSRRELFLKQLQHAERDVQEWPNYVKQVFLTAPAATTEAPVQAQVPQQQ